MRIELQFNSIVVDKQDMHSIVQAFADSSGYTTTPHRKPRKHRRRTKGKMRASEVIDSLIHEITEG